MARGAVFFVTLNEGYEYVGTNPIDEALRDRMTYALLAWASLPER